jgi:hypothetical protein
MQLIKMILASPYLDLITGIILFVSGVAESWQEFQTLDSFRFGVHHGVVLFSIVQIIKSLPDIFEGLEFLNQAGEHE